jgi:hypothetical protein
VPGTLKLAEIFGMANDPIFAAIEAHRAAVLALNAADEAASEEASDVEIEALRNLLSCPPTTMKGVIALLDHLGKPQSLHDSCDPATVLSGAYDWYGEEQTDVLAFPRMLATALRNIIGES